MNRVQQPRGARGSLRWMQAAVNLTPTELCDAIGCGPIDWRSPLASDDYAEYRDGGFVDRLDLVLHKRSLDSFWPSRGPQWDALGIAKTGEVILVEAKAHVSEMLSLATGAKAASSLERIRRSLRETADALNAGPGVDWSQRFYQYTNRLAHAFLLHELNGIPTRLVFLHFVGDTDMDGPQSVREWQSAIEVLHEAIGLRGRMPKYVSDAFLHVDRLKAVGPS